MLGKLLIIALMGGLCALFVFLFFHIVRTRETGVRGVIRLARLMVSAICAVWFGYLFISLLIALPRILAG